MFNNLTIANNFAAMRGGGIFAEHPVFSTTPLFNNSIVAGNSALKDNDCLGVPLYGVYNLIGDGEGCPGFDNVSGNLTGTPEHPLDARLAPLGNYGGATPTQALLVGSPAINAGSPAPPGADIGSACERTDQRLRSRPGGGRCDIGAFERKQ